MNFASKPLERRMHYGIAWALSGLVSLLAVIAWGGAYNWRLHLIGGYQLFPLLGLLAFSLMWTHYVTGWLTTNVWSEAKLEPYYRWTGYAVLLAIVLHPGILIFERFKDGYGLPPGSYTTYVAPGLAWVVMLGSVSLLIFLAYELHRFYERKSWWKYVLYAGDAAMIAILYHGLRLGGQLMQGWYRSVWIFYGVILILILLATYFGRIRQSTES